MSLESLGFDARFAEAFVPHGAQGLAPARVLAVYQGIFRVSDGTVERYAEIAGKMRHSAESRVELPAVGDFVAVRVSGDRAVIHAILPRKSKFSRKTAGNRTDEQVVAANVDTVFLIAGLDHDWNPRRLERYLTLAQSSGAQPVVLLTKADLAQELEARRGEAVAVAPNVPLVVVSAVTGLGVDTLAPYLGAGRTVALLGSSGVGKSTLLNALLGSATQRTAEVRESDSRGRHTTTHRELFVLPGGALVIDTPGMRELQLLDTTAGLDDAFDDLAALAKACRFRDCTHAHEPGCAVRAAIERGELTPERLASFHKLGKELAHAARRADKGAGLDHKQRTPRHGKKNIKR